MHTIMWIGIKKRYKVLDNSTYIWRVVKGEVAYKM